MKQHRALPVGHELAGRVVDRGDVVGVEGVPHAQGVGGDAQPDPEGPGRAEVVVARGDQQEQRAPADHVQRGDERCHAGDRGPLAGGQGVADAADLAVSRGSRGGHRVLPATRLRRSGQRGTVTAHRTLLQ